MQVDASCAASARTGGSAATGVAMVGAGGRSEIGCAGAVALSTGGVGVGVEGGAWGTLDPVLEAECMRGICDAPVSHMHFSQMYGLPPLSLTQWVHVQALPGPALQEKQRRGLEAR